MVGRLVGEKCALKMRERRLGDIAVGRPELLDLSSGQALQVFGRASKRGERGAARLVRQRHDHIGSPGERFEEGPLRPRQVFEAIRVDRLAVPGGEVRLQPLGRTATEQVSIPPTEPVELRAIGAVERRDARIDLLGRTRHVAARLDCAPHDECTLHTR